MLRTDDLDFQLPPERIATTPVEPRDSARMLVVSRRDAAVLEHRRVRDLPEYLRPGDLLVLNATRVLRARFQAVRPETGGRIEGLYLGPAPGSGRRWTALLKAKHVRPGVRFVLGEGVSIELVARSEGEPGAWVVAVDGAANEESDAAVLERVGKTPLPPYILAARKQREEAIADEFDRERYQTVFAHEEGIDRGQQGSVAAPTAGLHLTPAVFTRLDQGGVRRIEVVLHVGTGTFKPVETEFVEQHPMHAEGCFMSGAAIEAVREARARGGRVFCVGTTSARTVESYAAAADGGNTPEHLDTRMLITPGYRWRWTEGMLTNFHLPRSTLLAMVGALFESSGGLARLKSVYQEAIREGYRFFSYGDAMLILP